MPTTATPAVLTDPGYLFWAPLTTAAPTHTVSAAGKFTDSWPASWISIGATEDGSEFTYETKVEAVQVAEFFDPIKWSTTERSGSFAFNMADWSIASWNRAMNGGTVSAISGSGTASALTSYVPPTPGAEVRCMLGWESLDNTARLVVPQCINGGTIKSAFKKAPNLAVIPCVFNFEIPSSGTFSAIPWKLWTAGNARQGT